MRDKFQNLEDANQFADGLSRRVFITAMAAAATACAPTPLRRAPRHVVFLHSLGGSPKQWAKQIGGSLAGRVPIALPWAGHGNIPLPAGPPAIERLAMATASQLRAMGVTDAVLVGHSAGASVALALSEAAPDMVRGLVLGDPSGDLSRLPKEGAQAFLKSMRSREAVRKNWEAQLQGSKAETRLLVLNDLERTAQATIDYVLEAGVNFAPFSILQRLRVPVMIIRTAGSDFPHSLHKLMPKLETHVLPAASHWLQMDQPERFNDLLASFLGRVTAAA